MINFTDSSKILLKTSGIYIIKHIPTDKVYIGSTNNTKLRFVKHRRLLRANKHHSQHLQSAYNKYKESEFCFYIIEETQDLVNREQYYLDYYKSYNKKYGYNISPTAYNNTGIVRSEEYKRKKAEAYAKTWYIVETPDGVIIRTRVLRYFEIYDDKGSRIKDTHVKQGLWRLVTGKTVAETYHGWKCYFEDLVMREKSNALRSILKNKQKGIVHSGIEKAKETRKRLWRVYFPDGHEEIVKGLQEVGKKYGLTNISRAAATGMSCKGFRFEKTN